MSSREDKPLSEFDLGEIQDLLNMHEDNENAVFEDIDMQERHEGVQRETSRMKAIGNAFASTFTKVNRILAGVNDINVLITEDNAGVNAPAWTDGEHVYLNKAYVNKSFSSLFSNAKIDFSQVAEVKGLNYHELAHIFYTPRMQDKITKTVRAKADMDSDYWYAYNVLEDMRAESSIIHVYSKMIDYFTYTVIKYILNSEDDNTDTAYFLLSGRYFLPIEMRNMTRSLFAQKYGTKFTQNMDSIVKQYVTEVTYTSARYSEGFDLIERFVLEVIKPMRSKSGQALPKCIGGSSHQQHHNAGAKRGGHWGSAKEVGNMWKGKTQVADQKEVKPFIKDLIDEVETLEQKAGKLGAKAGKGSTDNLTSSEVNVELEKILDIVEKSPQFKSDVKITQKDISHKVETAIEDSYIKGLDMKPDLYTPSSSTLATKVRLRRYFRQLRIDLEQDWLTEKRSGKVDLGRYMSTKHLGKTDIFKRWKPNDEDKASAECVILVDMSGSMSGVMDSVSQITWLLKSELDNINVRTSVLGFANNCYKLYTPNQKADRGQYSAWYSGGGTQPIYTLKQANKILEQSDRHNKVVIALTDGAWTNYDEEIEEVKKLSKNCDSSNVLFFGSYFRMEDDSKNEKISFSHFDNLIKINKIEDTVQVAKQLVTDIVNKVLNK